MESALSLLGEILEHGGGDPVHFYVVGGSALLASGIATRTTYDVDILARRGEIDGGIQTARPLPEAVEAAAAQVADEFRLRPNWLNTGPTWVAAPLESYPAEFWTDTLEREYGNCLTISFVSRTGLIYLKFHAALSADRKRRQVDIEDLQLVNPSREETGRVIVWLEREELIHAGNRGELADLVTILGYEDLVS